MTFGAPGKAWIRPTVPTCRPGYAADDPVHHLDESRGGEQRVVALVHRRRPGVIRESGDRDLPLLDADDPLDDPDVDLVRLERAALLDVELEIAGDVALLPLAPDRASPRRRR